MKRSIAVFIPILVLFLVLAGFSWIFRDGLAREPGDRAFSLQSPQSAFPMPDGGFAVIDSDSRRIVRFNATGLIRWEIRPWTLFGRFLAVDADPEGMLYGIDEIAYPASSATGTAGHSQRLVRIGLDGSLAAVLLERKVAGESGFIPGSLRVKDDVLWYLYDDGAAIVLASLDTATLAEHVAGRSDWVLYRASLAPGGPGGIVAVAAEGALALFQRDRFETLSEYAARLPYPACIRYDDSGSLYIADPVAGLILRIGSGGEQEVIVSASNGAGATGSAVIPGFAFDNFSIGPEGLVLVDRQASSVLVVDPGSGPGSGDDTSGSSGQARIVRKLAGFSVTEPVVKRSWLAWMFLAGSLLVGLVAFFIGVYISACYAPKPLAILGASLPGLLGIILVLALAWYASELGRQSVAESASLERLRAAAVAGAGALSGLELSGAATMPGTSAGILSDSAAGASAAAVDGAMMGLIHPRSSEGWDHLRHRLALMVDSSMLDGWPPVSAVLYLESAGMFRYICDSDGVHVPGMAQALVPDSFEYAVSLRRATVGAVVSGGQRWLSASAPLVVPADGPAILLEMSSPVRISPQGGLQSLLVRYIPELDLGGLSASFIIALAAFVGLPLLVSGRREAEELTEYRMKLSSIDDKRRAVAALRAGNADEARRILEDFMERNPDDPQALNNLGAAYVRLGRLDEGIRCFDAVIQEQPGNATAKANLARLKDRLAGQRSSSQENRR